MRFKQKFRPKYVKMRTRTSACLLIRYSRLVIALSSSFLALNAFYYYRKRTKHLQKMFCFCFFCAFAPTFHFKPCIFFVGGSVRRNISCPRAQVTLAPSMIVIEIENVIVYNQHALAFGFKYTFIKPTICRFHKWGMTQWLERSPHSN